MKIVHEWRCSKCGTVVATTTTALPPGVGSCPKCGVRFINGGSNFLRPPANLPPANNPPGNMPPGMMPPGNMPPQAQPAIAPPANAPADPVVAPPADPGPLDPPAAFAARCQWCSGEVSPGNRYCWGCKLMAIGITLGGTFVLVVAGVACAIVVVVLTRSRG